MSVILGMTDKRARKAEKLSVISDMTDKKTRKAEKLSVISGMNGYSAPNYVVQLL
ncbi:hypothetical protein GCM10026983_18850 [Gracilibacillus alcaliphilus]